MAVETNAKPQVAEWWGDGRRGGVLSFCVTAQLRSLNIYGRYSGTDEISLSLRIGYSLGPRVDSPE